MTVDTQATPEKKPAQPGVFDLFRIGIGPSSSHTVGPMKAAAAFAEELYHIGEVPNRIRITLFGSLAWTGEGHGTAPAIAMGLTGAHPETIDPASINALFSQLQNEQSLRLPGGTNIRFNPQTDIIADRKDRSYKHPNTMRFEAFDVDDTILLAEIWLSLGGGFIAKDGKNADIASQQTHRPFTSAAELLALAARTDLTIAQVMRENEAKHLSENKVHKKLDYIIDVMLFSIENGLTANGTLPGSLNVERRAKSLFDQLCAETRANTRNPSQTMEYVSAFAIAVNEENAAGGRIVTAPTNGAAGIVPAVLRYYQQFCDGSSREGMQDFLLTAAAIGSIIKSRASISGAEVGCQGEVGSASAMAAAGLCAALDGTNEQIENAAEIALEHHLGMTCDPIGGLVQIPCIERNAFGAIKAINAAALALRGDGTHRVSFDQVVETMRQTGRDMSTKYKETSRGGLAVNVPEC